MNLKTADKWGRVGAWLGFALVIYAGSYLALRHRYSGNLLDAIGYSKILSSPRMPAVVVGPNRIEMPRIGPSFPDLPAGFNRGINAIFYPARKLDGAVSGFRMNFENPKPPFSKSLLYP